MATRSDLLRPRSSGKNERVAPVLQTFAPFPKMSVRQYLHAISVRKTSGMMESWNRTYQDCSLQGWEKFQLLEWGFLSGSCTCVVKENVSLISSFCFIKPLMVRSIKKLCVLCRLKSSIRMLNQSTSGCQCDGVLSAEDWYGHNCGSNWLLLTPWRLMTTIVVVPHR